MSARALSPSHQCITIVALSVQLHSVSARGSRISARQVLCCRIRPWICFLPPADDLSENSRNNPGNRFRIWCHWAISPFYPSSSRAGQQINRITSHARNPPAPKCVARTFGGYGGRARYIVFAFTGLSPASVLSSTRPFGGPCRPAYGIRASCLRQRPGTALCGVRSAPRPVPPP